MHPNIAPFDISQGISKEQKTDLWNTLLSELSSRLSESAVVRWFDGGRVVRADADGIICKAASEIQQLFIEENYRGIFKDAVSSLVTPPVAVVWQPFTSPLSAPQKVERRESPTMPPARSGTGRNKKADLRQTSRKGPVRFTVSDKSNSHAAGDNDAEPGADADGATAKDYRFDNFVVGENSQVAYAAAKAVAAKPARTYNPLFIYSECGLGKTHLLKAIRNEALRLRPKSRVVYVTSEGFVNEYIEHLTDNSLVKFRKKYRNADLLLIDDIQFLAGKNVMQEEFFHTFNSLTGNHKQIVLSSECPPSEIKNLEERMISRLEWGMTAEIQAPVIETRLAILRRMIVDRRLKVPDWVVQAIAEKICKNVRRMEGALLRAAMYTDLGHAELTPEILEDELLADFLRDEISRKATIDDIQKVVAEYFDLRVADLTGCRRLASVAHPRQVAMFLSRSLTDSSLKDIGEAFGGRDHGTVIHACKKISKNMDSNGELRKKVDFLRRKLRA